MGALIGARLGKFLANHLNISDTEMHFWTDSMIAFHWIRSCSKQWKPFVENRVSEMEMEKRIQLTTGRVVRSGGAAGAAE